MSIRTLLGIFILVVGCSSRSAAGFAESCSSDGDCSSGMCDPTAHRCTKACSALGECNALGVEGGCAHSADGSLRCAFGCDVESSTTLNGKWVVSAAGNVCGYLGAQDACELVVGCGCATCNADTFCDRNSGACTAIKAAGLPCENDYECTDGHCVSTVKGTRVCSVPLGSSCTDSNCAECRHVGTATVCALKCYSDTPCPTGTWCGIADGEADYTCLTSCSGDSDCPSGAYCSACRDCEGKACVTKP